MTTAKDETFPRLENWETCYRGLGNRVVKCARGEVYNDTRWPDGTHIYTSKIKKVTDGVWLQTKNTLYRLGTPAPKDTNDD